MTEQEVINLSTEVAELYRIEASTPESVEHWTVSFWLHDDWQRLMPLAIENELEINFDLNGYNVPICCVHYIYGEQVDYDVLNNKGFHEIIGNHPTKERAVAVAILKALKAKAETK